MLRRGVERDFGRERVRLINQHSAFSTQHLAITAPCWLNAEC